MHRQMQGMVGGLVAAALLLPTGCFRPDGLTDEQLDAAIAKTKRQNPGDLIAAVTDLVEAHRQEVGVMVPNGEGPHRRIAATQWVFQQFAALGMEPQLEETETEGYPISNVVAEIKGRTRPEELVLVSAHHDVWYLGADDNSSGVVAMLAAAATLRDSEPERTIQFVAMDQEETTDFYGARYHFDHIDCGRVRAVVNLDSLAYADRSPGSQDAPLGFSLPDVADFLAVIGNEAADDLVLWATQLAPKLPHPVRVIGVFGVRNNAGPLLGDLRQSDHAPAWERGLAGVFATDTTYLRTEINHTANDTVDTLEPIFFAGTTELTIALTWAAQAFK